ncbi:hypothetical protein ACLKA7_006942 [Drosophila subpalustris]
MMLQQKSSDTSVRKESIDRELWSYPTPRVRFPFLLSSPTHSRHTRSRPLTHLLIAGGVLCMIAPIICFNLEQRQPLIKYGHQNSYFGYSLATHTIGEYNWTNNTKW